MIQNLMLPLDFCLRIVREFSDSASKLSRSLSPDPALISQTRLISMPDARSLIQKGGTSQRPRDAGVVLARRQKRGSRPGVFGETVAKTCSSSLSVVFLAFFFLLSWTYPVRSWDNEGSNGPG